MGTYREVNVIHYMAPKLELIKKASDVMICRVSWTLKPKKPYVVQPARQLDQ
jgi:hypothetical protein